MDRIFTKCVALLVACGGGLGPVLAQADPPAPGPSAPPVINARQLGIADAILEYCKKAYPSMNDKWEYEVKRLTRGASTETLQEVRSSDPYRQARTAEANFVAQIEPVNAKHVCSRSLTRKPAQPAAQKTALGRSAASDPARPGRVQL
jgi:hypothetical protein